MKERKVVLDKTLLNEFIESSGLKSRENLAREIGMSPSTITNATTVGEGITGGTFEKIKKVLALNDEQVARVVVDNGKPSLASDDPPRKFVWEEAVEAAEYVVGELFGDEKFNPDAVLTFPGPSSIFAGLVLAKLPTMRVCLRTQVYTAILRGIESPDIPGYERWSTDPKRQQTQFSLFVPSALTKRGSNSYQRIAVIDDTIISGVTMETLRDKFKEINFPKANLTFACFVCWRPRTYLSEDPPEIIYVITNEEKFILPWGPSYSFEEHVPDVLTEDLVPPRSALEHGSL